MRPAHGPFRAACRPPAIVPQETGASFSDVPGVPRRCPALGSGFYGWGWPVVLVLGRTNEYILCSSILDGRALPCRKRKPPDRPRSCWSWPRSSPTCSWWNFTRAARCLRRYCSVGRCRGTRGMHARGHADRRVFDPDALRRGSTPARVVPRDIERQNLRRRRDGAGMTVYYATDLVPNNLRLCRW